MINEIEEQKTRATHALMYSDLLTHQAEELWDRWATLDTLANEAYEQWRVEVKILERMMEANHEQRR